MRNKLVAALVLVVAVAGGWFYFQSKVIKVWLYTDYAFRFKHADWAALAASRFKEVNRIYKSNGTGVRWMVVDASQADPVGEIPGIDNRRANLALRVDNKADVFVVITGIHEGERTGSASPFTRVAIVVDFPEKSETLNARLMAHELAHLFGAPYDPAWRESLMAEKPEGDKFSDPTIDLIKRMRSYPFALGIDGMEQDSWEKKALAAVAEDDTPAHSNAMSHAHLVLGTALLNARKKDAALVHFRAAVDGDPKNVIARLNLAEAYTRNGQDDKALDQVREMVRLLPDNPLSHRALGAVLGRTHQPEEALKELRLAARMEPNNADDQVLIGMQLAGMSGRLDEGIAALQEALRLNPGVPMAREGIEKARVIKERTAEELVTERGLIQRNPNDPDAHFRLADAEMRSGDMAGALRDLQKTAELRPASGMPHVALAELYCATGSFANAWAEVRKAQALGTTVPTSLIARMPAQK